MKINFTTEHNTKLLEALTEMLISGRTIKGLMGVEYNVHQLLHELSINTIQKMYIDKTKEVTTTASLDEWSMKQYQQEKLNQLKKDQEMIHLLIGYKKYQSESLAALEKLKEKKNLLKKLQDETKTPDQRIKELAEEIAEMEKN